MDDVKEFNWKFSEEEVREVRNLLLDFADSKKIQHGKMAVMGMLAVQDMAHQLDLNIKSMFESEEH